MTDQEKSFEKYWMKLQEKRMLKLNSRIDYHRRQYGVHIDSVDRSGNTLLMSIIQLSVSQAIELINAGADVNKTNNEGATALMLAVSSRNKEEVSELITHLISAGVTNTINNVQHQRRTALDIAYGYRNVEACCMLLGAGASASIPIKDGVTLFKFVEDNLNYHRRQKKQDLNEIKMNEVIYSAMQSSVEAELIVATVLSSGPLQNVIVHDSTTKAKKARRI